MMSAAWRAHPADYLLAFRIAERLWGTSDDRLGEMLAWARVAVALRPDSPFPHTLLATTFRGMHNWVEAEASARRAIELGRKYPKYAGVHTCLGSVLLYKGDLAGAEASYRAAIAIDPSAAASYYNLGLVRHMRGDLAGAEEWYQKAVATEPGRAYWREVLTNVQKLARMDAFAAGRAVPGSPAEAIEFAEAAYKAPARRYVLAVRLYRWAFAADSALADDIQKGHRYNAACLALRAAAGQDQEMTEFGVDEWAFLNGIAIKWLRADLACSAAMAKDSNQRAEMLKRLAHWKVDEDMAPVREPSRRATMPAADREAWQSLWADVDAAMAAIAQDGGSPK
jgi:tetratricopeptide (TPR) repeat protein